VSPRTVVALGRAPGTGSVLPRVLALLQRRGHAVEVVVVDGVPTARDLGRMARADLLVPRGLGADALDALAALERDGVRACNPVAATAGVRDKLAARAQLVAAAVPVPDAAVCSTWEAVRRRAAASPCGVVVKDPAGSRGRGVRVLDPGRAAPAAPDGNGPWLVEDRVAGDGLDRKLYVVGEHVDGVLRCWPPRDLADKRGRSLTPDPLLRDTALAAARATGLALAGVDVVVGPDGPVVVDVNAFPGYKGVPGAAARIAALLDAAARGDVAAPAPAVAPQQEEALSCAS
jgi:ribosomal protein S6--L-glutamate ligase